MGSGSAVPQRLRRRVLWRVPVRALWAFELSCLPGGPARGADPSALRGAVVLRGHANPQPQHFLGQSSLEAIMHPSPKAFKRQSKEDTNTV